MGEYVYVVLLEGDGEGWSEIEGVYRYLAEAEEHAELRDGEVVFAEFHE